MIGFDARLDAGAPVRVAHHVHIALPGLVRDREANTCGGQPRRCLHHGHVDRVRALRAAKNQDPCRVARRRRVVIRVLFSTRKELRPHWIAGDESRARKKPQRFLECHRRCTHHACEQPVSNARQRVLLQQHRWVAAQRRQHQHRTRGEAADANDDRRACSARPTATRRWPPSAGRGTL